MRLLRGTSPSYCKSVLGEMFGNSESPFDFVPFKINISLQQKGCITGNRTGENLFSKCLAILPWPCLLILPKIIDKETKKSIEKYL